MEKWERNYDKWKLKSPWDDEKVFCHCEHCDSEIYEGEEYMEVDDANVHEDCFNDYAYEVLNPIKKIAGEDDEY